MEEDVVEVGMGLAIQRTALSGIVSGRESPEGEHP
jgi:hypothetical protein